MFLFIMTLHIISPQSPISLDDMELVIEGDIKNDHYISNVMEAIEKYYNVSKYINALLYTYNN